jgi:uncharacterized membrane protein
MGVAAKLILRTSGSLAAAVVAEKSSAWGALVEIVPQVRSARTTIAFFLPVQADKKGAVTTKRAVTGRAGVLLIDAVPAVFGGAETTAAPRSILELIMINMSPLEIKRTER